MSGFTPEITDALTTATASLSAKPATRDYRLPWIVACNLLASSVAAYSSGLLIFDEARWYRIDSYDGFVWGWIVIQTFAVAQYASRFRSNALANSIRTFLMLGLMAVGLTLAAVGFLSVDALKNSESLLPIFAISGGYLVAVFIFLIAIFLQFRLALVCLSLVLKSPSGERDYEPRSDEHSCDLESHHRFTMADAFAFTGLAAVCITAYRLTRDSMTDGDTLQLLGLFYAAAILGLVVYVVVKSRFNRLVKTILCVGIVAVFTAGSYQVMWYVKTPLRLQFTLPLTVLWTTLIVASAAAQTRMVELLSAKSR